MINELTNWQTDEVRKVLALKVIQPDQYRLVMTNQFDFPKSELRNPYGLIVEMRRLLKEATAQKWLVIKMILESRTKSEWLERKRNLERRNNGTRE